MPFGLHPPSTAPAVLYIDWPHIVTTITGCIGVRLVTMGLARLIMLLSASFLLLASAHNLGLLLHLPADYCFTHSRCDPRDRRVFAICSQRMLSIYNTTTTCICSNY